MIEWLTTTLDPSRAHDIGLATAWHARLMVLAWLIFLPVGVLAARFFKITPGQSWPDRLDNKAWWYTHLGAQYAGGAAVLGGLLLAWLATRFMAGGLHANAGWIAAALLLVQFLGGWLRGSKGGPTAPNPDGSLSGDHYDMTPRRRIFERVHKSVGYLALLVALVAIATGLWRVNAPRWMALVTALWTALVVLCAFALQRRGMAIDTYQAIWGPDETHPGNRTRPIGIGVRRPRQRRA